MRHSSITRRSREAALLAQIRRLRAQIQQERAAHTEAHARAEAELRHIVSAANHDLRAPLRHVEQFTELLLDDHRDELPATAIEALHHQHQAALRLGQRLEALILMLRQTAAPPRLATTDLAALLHARCQHTAARYPALSVEVEPIPACWAEVDAHLLALALDALLDNAWRFMAATPAPRLVSSLEPSAKGWSLRLRDSGVGFNPRYAEQLGPPFRKLHARHDGGPGLGIPLASRVMRLHNGTLHISAAPNQGACVRIWLPSLRPRP